MKGEQKLLSLPMHEVPFGFDVRQEREAPAGTWTSAAAGSLHQE